MKIHSQRSPCFTERNVAANEKIRAEDEADVKEEEKQVSG